MRLLLLFTFVFVIILQITCNNNECGRQSALISCTDIDGQATFIHVSKNRNFDQNRIFSVCFYLVLGNVNRSSDVSSFYN